MHRRRPTMRAGAQVRPKQERKSGGSGGVPFFWKDPTRKLSRVPPPPAATGSNVSTLASVLKSAVCLAAALASSAGRGLACRGLAGSGDCAARRTTVQPATGCVPQRAAVSYGTGPPPFGLRPGSDPGAVVAASRQAKPSRPSSKPFGRTSSPPPAAPRLSRPSSPRTSHQLAVTFNAARGEERAAAPGGSEAGRRVAQAAATALAGVADVRAAFDAVLRAGSPAAARDASTALLRAVAAAIADGRDARFEPSLQGLVGRFFAAAVEYVLLALRCAGAIGDASLQAAEGVQNRIAAELGVQPMLSGPPAWEDGGSVNSAANVGGESRNARRQELAAKLQWLAESFGEGGGGERGAASSVDDTRFESPPGSPHAAEKSGSSPLPGEPCRQPKEYETGIESLENNLLRDQDLGRRRGRMLYYLGLFERAFNPKENTHAAAAPPRIALLRMKALLLGERGADARLRLLAAVADAADAEAAALRAALAAGGPPQSSLTWLRRCHFDSLELQELLCEGVEIGRKTPKYDFDEDDAAIVTFCDDLRDIAEEAFPYV